MTLGLCTATMVVLHCFGGCPPRVACEWDHPCAADPGGTLDCTPAGLCWCDADWDVGGNWDYCGDPPDDYPESSCKPVYIGHSNTGYCDHWTRNPCSEDDDCPGRDPTCEDIEGYVIIELTTETIKGMKIETTSTHAMDDSLTLYFESKGICVGGGDDGDSCNDDDDCTGIGTCEDTTRTLNTRGLELESEYGPVSVILRDSAKLTGAYLALDATDGDVTLRVETGSEFQTDTTD